MKTLFKASLLASVLAIAPAALAEDTGWYGDVGLGQLNIDINDTEVSVTMIQGRIGYDFNDYFGAEGELAFALDGDTVNSSDFGFTPNVKIDAEVNETAAIYGVLSTANKNGFEFFGRAGYIQAEVKGSASIFSIKSEADGFAYGVGAKYYFDGLNGVRLDLTSIQDEATNISLAYTRKF